MTIQSMRIACLIIKATNTHSEYVVLTAFSLQQCLSKHASVLRCTYVASPVIFKNMCTTGSLNFCIKLWRDAKILCPNFEHTRQILEGEVGRSCDNMGEKSYVYTVLARKRKERQIGRPKRRWDDNVKMNSKDISL